MSATGERRCAAPRHDALCQGGLRVWGCQIYFDHPEVTAKAGIDALRRFFISIGMPKNFAELGAKEEDIPKLAESLCRGNGRQGSLTGLHHFERSGLREPPS